MRRLIPYIIITLLLGSCVKETDWDMEPPGEPVIVVDGIITDVKFKTFGCGAAIATSSMATEMVKGKSVDEALKLTNKAVMEALDGLPAVKIHCSLLAEEAIHAAIEDYQKKQAQAK